MMKINPLSPASARRGSIKNRYSNTCGVARQTAPERRKEMEELGKLIRDLFDEQRNQNYELRTALEKTQSENVELRNKIDAIKTVVEEVVYQYSNSKEHYISSIWGKKAEKIFDALAIEFEEEEENDDNL